MTINNRAVAYVFIMLSAILNTLHYHDEALYCIVTALTFATLYLGEK